MSCLQHAPSRGRCEQVSDATCLRLCAGAVSGQLGAIVVWLITCKAYYGSVNVKNLGGDYPMLAGNVTALGLSLIVTTAVTFIKPDNYDWDNMRTGIRMIEVDGTDLLKVSGEDSEEGLHKALKCAPLAAMLHLLRFWNVSVTSAVHMFTMAVRCALRSSAQCLSS